MPDTLPEIEGETARSTQPICPGCDRSADYVSQTGSPHAERSTHRRLDRRTVAKIQGKVVKQGKRNAFHRFVLSKTDKDKIAGWKQEFMRVLHVFNVRSIGFVVHSFANLTATFQTELAIDTNMMVADIYRNILTEQEGSSRQKHSVGTTFYRKQRNAYHPLDSSKVSDTKYYGVHSLIFS
jgi:hypothetical protein